MPATPEQVEAARALEGFREQRVGPPGIERMAEEGRSRSRTEAETRRAAGMGLWRLVWIVALGILFAQAIGGALIAAFRLLAG